MPLQEPQSHEPDPDPNILPPPLDFTKFEVLPTAKPRSIIKDILDDSSRMVFGGPAKSFKSWGLCDLALSLAAEIPWLEFETFYTPGLYVNFELRDFHFQQRLKSIKKAKGIKKIEPGALEVWNLRGIQIKLQHFIDQLSFWIEKTKRLAVYVDPFYKLLGEGKDERVSSDLNPILVGFNQINRRTGASIISALHFVKGNQSAREPAERISGGGNLIRDPDSLLTFTGHENKGESILDFTLRDYPSPESFTVKWDFPLLCRSNSDPDRIRRAKGGREGYDARDLQELIADHDDQLSSDDLVKKAKQELGWSERTVFNKLKILRREKKVFLSKMNQKWNIKSP